MPGISFTTAGDGKDHTLSERGVLSDNTLYRIRVSNDKHDLSGGSVTGGPLGVGTDRILSTVLEVGSEATLRYAILSDFIYNDFGTACQLSLTWNVELVIPEPGEAQRGSR